MKPSEQQLKEQAIAATLGQMGLGARFEFVPVSASRNAESKWQPPKDATGILRQWSPTLNWRVTVTHKGRDLFTTDYSAGCAHAPAYAAPVARFGHSNSMKRHGAIMQECETGREYREFASGIGPKLPAPSLADLFYSLSSDSDAIDSPFEDWASNLGFDPDSRKAESIYKACLDIAIRLRAAIGEDGLAQLRDLFQDY